MTSVEEQIQESGKYQILSGIDGGMNAYAFKAHHIHLGIDVFIKAYDYVESESTLFLEPRYLMEMCSCKSVSPYLLRIFDADVINSKWVVIATEFIEGSSLLDAIANNSIGCMSAIEIAKKILNGLIYLHSKGFVHRDLKPANIMLDLYNGEYIPKIADFGSVARLRDGESFTKASRHSALYVPPEGWLKNEYGVQSDVYQVGVVLYEMLNGCLPYDEHSYIDSHAKRELKQQSVASVSDLDAFGRSKLIDGCLSRRACTSNVLNLQSPKPYYIARLKRIVNKATHPSIDKRYQSPSDFFGDLSELHLPNWRKVGDKFVANNWHGYNWSIENNKHAWHGKRTRIGSTSFRKYFDGSIDEVISAINRI